HRPELGGERATGSVLEALAGLEQRLLADDARTAHLLRLPVGVGDHPVAIQETYGLVAFVADRDRVEEEPERLLGLRVLRGVAGSHPDTHPTSDGFRLGDEGF